jgi:flagellar basal body-associated protein FliL
MQEKQSKRKQNIILLVVLGIALVFTVLFQFYLSGNANEINTEVVELVGKYNQKCPLIIQDGIRLDSLSLPEKRVVQYNLTLLNVEKETAEIDIIHKEIEKSLLSTAKANPGLQVFRENDFTLIYNYSDKKNVFLFKVTVLPDQYK